MPTTFNQIWLGLFLLVAALAAASDFNPAETQREVIAHFADFDVCGVAFPAHPCEPEPGAAR